LSLAACEGNPQNLERATIKIGNQRQALAPWGEHFRDGGEILHGPR
jgi:hypothetical protein